MTAQGSRETPGGPALSNVVLAARSGNAVFMRVMGLGNMHNAVGMWDFAEDMVERGYRRFCMDLAQCRGMDSTFMGTLVGLSARLKELGEGYVALVNVAVDNRALLEVVGADKFLRMKGVLEFENIEMEVLPSVDAPLERRIEQVRKAHESLMVLDKRNEERFGPFMRLLISELNGGAGEMPAD
jgi:anti-anti-sigma regulatory factor